MTIEQFLDTQVPEEQARLWRAAPDLLAACKASLLAMDGQGQICVELRAAIAKASGASATVSPSSARKSEGRAG